MSDLIRDAPIGQLIRLITRGKVLRYPEEEPRFQCPNCYAHSQSSIADTQHESVSTDDANPEKSDNLEKTQTTERQVAHSPSGTASLEDYETPRPTEKPDASRLGLQMTSTSRSQGANLDRVASRNALQQYATRSDLERAFTEATLERGPTQPVQPEKLEDGTILVDWYSTDDPANPQNWSSGKKVFVAAQIWSVSFAILGLRWANIMAVCTQQPFTWAHQSTSPRYQA